MKAGGARFCRAGALAGCVAAAPASAAVVYNVSFDDAGAAWSSYYGEIGASLQAAGAQWGKYLVGDAILELSVRFADIPTASGFSATSAFVGTNGSYTVWEQGAAAELRTGVDPNGAAPDALITIGKNYLTHNLWFDPSPLQRTAPVPLDRTDAESVFIHELGHTFGFNGWRNGTTGALPGFYESTFDELVSAGNGVLVFTGPRATGAMAGPCR